MATKAPKLFLRQSCVTDATDSWLPGTFLEVGAGTGAMTRMFLSRGFSGCCYDPSLESRTIIQSRLKNYSGKIDITESLDSLANASYEYLLAFEVLEHIEDDLSALQLWTRFLKNSGRLIVSVPAHKRKFSKVDELVGHVRRYEKDELFNLLELAGYQNIKIINYGFPLTELSRYLSTWILKKDTSDQQLSIQERSLRSSYSRPDVIKQYLSKVTEDAFVPFQYIQRLFYKYDLGDGFVAVAEKV